MDKTDRHRRSSSLDMDSDKIKRKMKKRKTSYKDDSPSARTAHKSGKHGHHHKRKEAYPTGIIKVESRIKTESDPVDFHRRRRRRSHETDLQVPVISGHSDAPLKASLRVSKEDELESEKRYQRYNKMKHSSCRSTSYNTKNKDLELSGMSSFATDQSISKWERWEKSNKKMESEDAKSIEKEKPNFKPSGKLAEDTNTFKGVVINYNEPIDARKPRLRWRLYPFKGEDALPVLYIHRQSAYLIGRNRKIADLPVDHPSCSKQHAVFQYRSVAVDLADGTTVRRIRPYIIDLNSANGTYLNGQRIESERFVELREKDVLKFGFSSREFVLLKEKSGEQEVSDSELPKDFSESPE